MTYVTQKELDDFKATQKVMWKKMSDLVNVKKVAELKKARFTHIILEGSLSDDLVAEGFDFSSVQHFIKYKLHEVK